MGTVIKMMKGAALIRVKKNYETIQPENENIAAQSQPKLPILELNI